MAGMIVQHNLNAINANNKLNANVLGVKKATEKLSSGFRINRAADDAAGLAISEKMRAQIRGLTQAIRNANDGISLIQTGEGALDETHDMLKRLKELAVQSGNETYSDEERTYMQQEIDAIKSEVDRIAKATDFNGIKLLDGSLGNAGGNVGTYGARYGILQRTGDLAGSSVTSSIARVTVTFTVNASGPGGENAFWDETGKTLTINLSNGVAYTQSQIDTLIKNANTQKVAQTAAVPTVTVKLVSGIVVGKAGMSFDETVAGVRASGTSSLQQFLVSSNSTEFYADTVKFTSNSYGQDTRSFVIQADVGAGKEWVETTKEDGNFLGANLKEGIHVVHLSSGVSYSGQDIQSILAKAGFDYTVEFSVGNDPNSNLLAPDGDVKFLISNTRDASGALIAITVGGAAGLSGGYGLGKDVVGSSGVGLTLQIGANNAVEQRLNVSIDAMDSSAIGIANISVRTVRDAQDAMDRITEAITKVSAQRAALGAVQNRLEHTINSLTTTTENITAAEAQIRDTDMATEMVQYTKFTILQQAAQAMLAQANQAPQAVLQLLQ